MGEPSPASAPSKAVLDYVAERAVTAPGKARPESDPRAVEKSKRPTVLGCAVQAILMGVVLYLVVCVVSAFLLR